MPACAAQPALGPAAGSACVRTLLDAIAAACAPNACRIHVRTFGRYTLTIDGCAPAASVKSPKRPLGLLKALIAFGGNGVALTTLERALWPDADGAASRNALNVALHRLRRLLGDPHAIVLRDSRLSLDPSRLWTDVAAFGRLVALFDARDTRIGAEAAGPLLALYAGHFLADEDASWAYAASDRLRGQFLRIASRIADEIERVDGPRDAVDYYRRLIAIDDMADGFRQGLTRCLRTLGREAEAWDAQARNGRLLKARFESPFAACRAAPALPG